MHSITENEMRLLDHLIRHPTERHNINQLARALDITPAGTHKILQKLEDLSLVFPEPLGNAIYYSLNYRDEAARALAQYILLQTSLNPYAKIHAEDLSRLRQTVKSCILFGSVLTKGKHAEDIDALLLLSSRKSFGKSQEMLKKINRTKSSQIHDLTLTEADLRENLRKRDPVLLEILRTGQVLWGAEAIVDAICHDASGQAARLVPEEGAGRKET